MPGADPDKDVPTSGSVPIGFPYYWSELPKLKNQDVTPIPSIKAQSKTVFNYIKKMELD